MSWRMGGCAIVGRRCAERVVRGGGRCSEVSVVASRGDPVLGLHARCPSEDPKGSSGDARGGARCGDAASHTRVPRT
eukprot:6981724-Prymnesium_polylepis.1